MIKVFFSFDDGCFHFKIDECIYFSQIIGLFKQKYHIVYDTIHKTWKTPNAITANAIVLDLQGYDTIDISKEDTYLLEDLIYPNDSNFIKVKRHIDEEFFKKHPPLKGKPPYENYQVEAIKKGVYQNKILYDIAVRHGKTYITCGVIYNLIKLHLIDRILIICRPEGVENFKVEILRFLGDIFNENDIGIVTSNNREIEQFFDKKIIITNYITFRLSGAYYNSLINSKAKKPKKKSIAFSKWGTNRLLILDEGQSINSYDSLQSHYIHLYKDDFSRIIDMSGSIGFNVLHLFSHTKLLVPESIPYSYSEWTNYLAIKGTRYSNGAIRELRPEKVKEFKERVLDKIQVSYRDCIQETDMYEKEIFIQMSDTMKLIYRSFIEQEINELTKNKNHDLTLREIENVFNTLTLVTSDISLLHTDYSKNWKFTDNSKLPILDSLLSDYIDDEHRKVVIWGNHPSILDKLGEHYKKYSPIIIHGQSKIKKEERVDWVQKFNTDPQYKLLICNYVLATSITLNATRQIYWDLPINSDNFLQSRKRIHGPMQKEPVESIYLLFNNSIDIYIYYNILQNRIQKKYLLSAKDEVGLDMYKKVFSAKAESYLHFNG